MKNELPNYNKKVGGYVVFNKDGKTAITNDGTKGGYFYGDSHQDPSNGISAIVDNDRPILVEGNEVIINKKTVQSEKVLTVKGTPKEILSTLNQMDGNGVAIGDEEAEILAKYRTGGKIGEPQNKEIERLKNLPYSKFLLEVLDSYKELNAEVGVKGYNQNSGEPIIGYFPNQYEYMYRSDSTGKPIRFFIDLGNEKYIHPFDINPKFNSTEQKRIEQKADYFVKEGNENYEKSIKELKENNELDIVIETLKKALKTFNIENQYDSSDIFKSSGNSILESKDENKRRMKFDVYYFRVNDSELKSNIKNLDLERFKDEYLAKYRTGGKIPIDINKLSLNEFEKYLEEKYNSKVELGDYKKYIYLSRIEVDKETRGLGIGSEIMSEIINYADYNDKKITLTPSTDYGASSVARLKDFYKNFGFVENKGRNKDFEISQSMYRVPVANKLKQGGELIKRADGSYSRRGLWDNIRDNVGSGRKPTKQMLEQEAKIRDKYHLGGDMTKHLAPNGKPSKLTHEQWHLVRTPEFRAWFGDWENDPENASKVVDKNGEPLILFQGQAYSKYPKGNYIFDKDNQGIFFSSNKKIANTYGNVIQVFVNAKNLKDIRNYYGYDNKKISEDKRNVSKWTGKYKFSELIKYVNSDANVVDFYEGIIDKYGDKITINTRGEDIILKDKKSLKDFIVPTSTEGFKYVNHTYKSAIWDLVAKYVRDSNYDGIICTDEDNNREDRADTFIVYNSNQVKLADGTNTNFDANNPDIRFKTGGSIKPNLSKMTPSELKEFYASPEGKKLDAQTYSEWKRLVNMTKSEIEKFYNSVEGKKAGLTTSQAKEQGIDSGRESARWIMKMKDIPYKQWSSDMWRWAKKQINFIKRMSGMKGRLYDDKGEKTRKHTALLIWGHNPEQKFDGGGDVKGYDNFKNPILINGFISNKEIDGKEIFLITYNSGGQEGLNVHQTMNPLAMLDAVEKKTGLHTNTLQVFIYEHTENSNRIETEDELEFLRDNYTVIIVDRDSVEFYNGDNRYAGGGGIGDEVDIAYNKAVKDFEKEGFDVIESSDSKTDFGHSRYFYVNYKDRSSDNLGSGLKVRVSDHGVTNQFRMAEELHIIPSMYLFTIKRAIIDAKIKLMDELFNREKGVNLIPYEKEVRQSNLKDTDIIISERFGTGKRVPITEKVYTVKRFREQPIIKYIDKETGEVVKTFNDELKRFKGGGELSKKALAVETNDLTDFVRKYFIKDGRIDVADAMQELFGNRRGKSIADEYRKRIGLHKKGGLTISQLAHNLWEQHRDEVREGIDDSDFRNAVEEVLISEYGVSSMIKSLMEKSGESEQDKENEYWMNQYDEGDDEYYEDLSDEEVNNYFMDMEGFESELAKGTEHEMEHLDTLKKVAEGKLTPEEAVVQTAKTHIKENPEYYEDLANMEMENKVSNLDNLMSIMDSKVKYQGYSLKELYDEVIKFQGSRDGALIFSEFIKRKKDEGDTKIMDEFNRTSFVENINEPKQDLEEREKKLSSEQEEKSEKELWEMTFNEFLSKVKLSDNSSFGKKEVIVSLVRKDYIEDISTIKNSNNENTEDEYNKLQLEKFHQQEVLNALRSGKPVPTEVVNFYSTPKSILFRNYGSATVFREFPNYSLSSNLTKIEQEESIPDLIEGLKVLSDSLEGAEKKEIEDVIEGLEILLESDNKFEKGGEFRMATGGKIVFKPITTPL